MHYYLNTSTLAYTAFVIVLVSTPYILQKSSGGVPKQHDSKSWQRIAFQLKFQSILILRNMPFWFLVIGGTIANNPK